MVMLCSTARLHSTTPTGNIPAAPEFRDTSLLGTRTLVLNAVHYREVPLYKLIEETEDKEACVRGQNGWCLPVKMYRWGVSYHMKERSAC